MANIIIQKSNRNNSYTSLKTYSYYASNSDQLDGYHAESFILNDSGLSYNFLNGFVVKLEDYSNIYKPASTYSAARGVNMGLYNGSIYVGVLNSLQIKGVIGATTQQITFTLFKKINMNETITITAQNCLICKTDSATLSNSTVTVKGFGNVYKINTLRNYILKYTNEWLRLEREDSTSYEAQQCGNYSEKIDVFKEVKQSNVFITNTLFCSSAKEILPALLG